MGNSLSAAFRKDAVRPTRRQLLQGGLIVGFSLSPLGRKAWAAGEQPSLRYIEGDVEGGDTGAAFKGFAPGGFIRIDPEGKVTLIIPNIEMGQGIHTAEAMLLAEELEIGLDQVRVVPAPPNEDLYKQPLLQSQTTGGSTSIRATWTPLRQAGAAARTMLIAAAAAEWKVDPAECFAERGAVTHRPSGRSLAYGALADAAGKQPIPIDVPLKPLDQFKLVGTPAKRVEGPRKINGSAVFGIDIRLPDMKVATVTASPVFGGKLKSVDDTAARAVPGVRDVVRLDDAVAVIGDHFWAARSGLEALKIAWDEGANAGVSTADLEADLKRFSETGKPILARQEGDLRAGWSRAAKRVEAVYQLPFLAHAALEPINCTVHVRPDVCEIWVGTQVPTAAQALAAKALGVPTEKVILHPQLIGGAFGRRLEADYVKQAVAIGKQVPYPVKIIWTREEDIRHDLYRPAYYDRIAAGLDAEGRPVAWEDHVTGGSVLGHYLPTGLPDGTLDSDAVEGAAEPPYALPNLLVDWVRADPPVPVSWWRGVGPTHNIFVVESFIDELAHAAGKDPLAYRLDLLAHNPRAAGALKLAAEKAGWKPGEAGATPGQGRGVALHYSFGSHVAVILDITVPTDGEVKVTRAVAAVDCGVVVNPDTVKAQIEGGLIFGLSAALHNAVTFAGGRVEQGNFDDYRQMRMNEAPPVEVHLVDSREEPGGIGETGTVSAAPALANAIFAATGKRIRKLPLLPELAGAAG